MTKIADLHSVGYFGMRDETPRQRLDSRTVVFGFRIEDIDKNEGFYKLSDAGDLQFAHYYKASKRECGSWSLATPALWSDGATKPIFSAAFDADNRYKASPTASYNGRKYAKGTPGIVLAASKEGREEKLFFSSFGDLIAHHRGKDIPDYSTLVFDINAKGEIDKDRKAGLHTAWWVQKLRDDLGALAWNLTKSRGDNTGWGLYKSIGDGSAVTVESLDPAIMAFASWERGGPFHPGHASDKHVQMHTPDGPVNSGHIWTRALFYMDQRRDGPLDFERAPHPKSQDGIFPYQVHLRWDDKSQRWRWHVKLPFLFLEPPKGPEDGPPPPDDYPPRGPRDPLPPVGPPDGPKGPEDFPPVGPIGDPYPPTTPDGEGVPPGGGVRLPPFGDWVKGDNWGGGKRRKKKPIGTLATPHKLFAPGFGITAHPVRTRERYLRHLTPADVAERDKWIAGQPISITNGPVEEGWSPEMAEIARILRESPVVAQLESFGMEKIPGKVTKIQDAYMPEVRQTDTYVQGTGPGMLVLTPPEIGMKDVADGFAPKDIQKVSKTGLLFLTAGKAADNVVLGWGEPNFNTGSLKNGFEFGTWLGDFRIRGVDASGNTDTTKVIDFQASVKHSGSWQYPSGATAGYVWTSDASGTGSWQPPPTGTGDVVGPTSSTTSAVARFADTTGKLLKDTPGFIVEDSGVATLFSDTPASFRIARDTVDGHSGFLYLTGLESTSGAPVNARTWKLRSEITAGTRDGTLAFYYEDPTTSPAVDVKAFELNYGGGVQAQVHGKLVTDAFMMPTGAAAGYVLTSDASGNGTWQTLPVSEWSSTTSPYNIIYENKPSYQTLIGVDPATYSLTVGFDDKFKAEIINNDSAASRPYELMVHASQKSDFLSIFSSMNGENSAGTGLVLKHTSTAVAGGGNNLSLTFNLFDNGYSGTSYTSPAEAIKLYLESRPTIGVQQLTVDFINGMLKVDKSANIVQVNSTLQIPSGAASGYVLTSDASGNASWQAPSGGGTSNVYGRFYLSADIINGGSWFTVVFDTVETATPANYYDTTTGEFTAPQDGWYLLHASATHYAASGEQDLAIMQWDSATSTWVIIASDGSNGSNFNHNACSTVVYLNTGDKISVHAYHTNTTDKIIADRGSFFSYTLLSAPSTSVSPGLSNSHIWFHGYGEVLSGAPMTEINELTWAGASNIKPFPVVYRQEPSAIGDKIRFLLPLESGTYKLGIRCNTYSDRGIIDVRFNGTVVATWDLYSATIDYNYDLEVQVTQTTSGNAEIITEVVGKNASSTNYYIPITFWWLKKV